jgi:hypothetical protein
VQVSIRNSETDEQQQLQCEYLAGCDGGGSRVRRALGIELDGDKNIARVLMIHFKSPARDILNPWGVAWHLQTSVGNLVAQDDVDTWTLHVPLPPGTDETTLDAGQYLRDFVGRDFDFQILLSNPWSPNQVVARAYRAGRVLLAGDSAHQVIPTGGYGMNTGVGDAIDLGWKLSAVLNGWGGAQLLASYEHERRQIALRNRAAAQAHFAVRVKIAQAFAEAQATGSLHEAGQSGDRRRARLGERIAAAGNAENESWGIEHGYRYEGSPVIMEEGSTPPPFSPLKCSPSTFPGSRLPHVLLADDTALLDKLGPELTLLAIGPVNTDSVVAAANSLGVPLTLVRLDAQTGTKLLERRLVLVRPDQHVVWRGDAPPPNPLDILRTAVGR